MQDGKDESTCSEGLESPTASSEPLHFLDRGKRNQGFLSSLRLGEGSSVMHYPEDRIVIGTHCNE